MRARLRERQGLRKAELDVSGRYVQLQCGMLHDETPYDVRGRNRRRFAAFDQVSGRPLPGAPRCGAADVFWPQIWRARRPAT